jgi:hypothetical protein
VRDVKRASILGLALAAACAACGGSASETPWPVEPENVDLGPSGETRRDDDLTKKPDAKTPETPPAKAKKVDPAAP